MWDFFVIHCASDKTRAFLEILHLAKGAKSKAYFPFLPSSFFGVSLVFFLVDCFQKATFLAILAM